MPLKIVRSDIKKLNTQTIVDASSVLIADGDEQAFRDYYKNNLALARENNIKSIAIPLISTFKSMDNSMDSLGYDREEAVRIAVDEISAFLGTGSIDIALVIPDEQTTAKGEKLYKDLNKHIDKYIDKNYIPEDVRKPSLGSLFKKATKSRAQFSSAKKAEYKMEDRIEDNLEDNAAICMMAAPSFAFDENHESKLEERMQHLTDTFSEYLMYLIQDKNMENAEVWKRAIVDKKIFSKIKTNSDYHPQKLTALCLCVGAKLNLDETRDLLARAGYALSPCDKTDIIFSYFIENEIYDMIELDIQLEEHGLPCVIS